MPDRFVLRLALFYGAFFVYLGLSMPFIPAWLAAKGLDARQIGIVLAAPMVVRVIAVPLATRIADRFGMLPRALIAASFASVLGFALVGAVSGFVAILAAYALAAAVLAPVLPFADAFALRGLKRHAASYGSVRLWGSVTFIVANVGGGLLLARLGAANVIWAVVAALGLGAAAALALEPLAPEVGEHRGRPQAGRIAVALAGLRRGGAGREPDPGEPRGHVRVRHPAMERARHPGAGDRPPVGHRRDRRGRVVRVVEPARRMVRRDRPDPAGRARRRGALDRHGVRPAGRSAAALQALHALSFAATHLGTMHYLAQAAPARRGATAQGDFVALQGIVFAVAMGLSGGLVEAYGSRAYGAMAAAAAVGAVFAGWALGRRRREPAV